MNRVNRIAWATFTAASLVLSQISAACTTIILTAKDGSHVYGRTLEWGAFDINSELLVIPRGHEFVAQLENGEIGFSWTGNYGGVTMNGFDKDYWLDGVNEEGLLVGANYHPGVAKYNELDPDTQDASLSALDMLSYIATSFASVAEVREGIKDLHVVSVTEPTLGFAAPGHFIVSDRSGETIVIEFIEGETVIFDAPLRVMTNSPSYDWHMTNLRTYINLSPVAIPTKEIGDLEFAPLGAGSGMIGLPGDYTPTSRFVRAVAATQTARETGTGEEAVYEVFRILDGFNVPLGAAEGDTLGDGSEGMRSATLWTTAIDNVDMKFYYHTMHNRRVRMLDLKKTDFGALDGIQRMQIDKEKEQDIEELSL